MGEFSGSDKDPVIPRLSGKVVKEIEQTLKVGDNDDVLYIGTISLVFDLDLSNEDPLDEDELIYFSKLVLKSLMPDLEKAFGEEVVITDIKFRYSCLEIISSIGITLSAAAGTAFYFVINYERFKENLKKVFDDIKLFKFTFRGKKYQKGTFVRTNLKSEDEFKAELSKDIEVALINDEINKFLVMETEKKSIDDENKLLEGKSKKDDQKNE